MFDGGQQMISRVRNGTQLWRAALILLAVFYVFSPAIHGTWLWDDDLEITANPLLRDPLGWRNAWLRPAGADYFPLKDTLQWMEWRVWGNDPAVYHLTNIILHGFSAFLIWGLLRRLFPPTRDGGCAAWWGGLLFAVHPLAVESVAWISELKNAFSLPLMLLALIGYVDWDARRQRRSYFWSVGFFAAALLAKSSVVMLPAVLLLYSAWRHRRLALSDLVASVPFFVLSMIFGLVTVRFQHSQFVLPGGPVAGDAASRIACAGLAIAFYLWKAVIPVALTPIYPSWTVSPAHAWQFLPWAGLILLSAWLWNQRATWGRHGLFGLGFFALNLLPVLGFVRMSFARFAWVADHFAYISLIGLVGLAAAVFFAALKYGSDSVRSGVFVASGGIVIAWAFLARSHASLFRDPTTLWTYALRRNPGAWVAQYNLGCELVAEQRLPEAVSRFEETLRIEPLVPEAENGLGSTLARLGRPQEAVDHLTRAVQLYPELRDARYNLGSAWMQEGHYEEAVGPLEAALQSGPRTLELLNNLGLALAHTGRIEEAVERYREALGIDPKSARVRDNLGSAYLLLGRPIPAISEFEAARRLNSEDAEAHFGLGNALVMTHRVAEAATEYTAAITIRPDFTAARQNLDAARQELDRRP